MAAFASQKQLDDWKARSDVVFHIAAYHYFSRHNRDIAIDVVNFDAGDIQFYNRTIDMTFGLDNDHQLAKYLQNNMKLFTFPRVQTYRQHLIAHIHLYNNEVVRRQRFFMVGLSPSEQHLLVDLNQRYQFLRGDATVHQMDYNNFIGGDTSINFATDGTSGATSNSDIVNNEISVAAEVKECERKYEPKKGEGSPDQLTPQEPSTLETPQSEEM